MRYGRVYRIAVARKRLIMQRVKTSTGSELAGLANSFVRLERLKIRISEAERKGIFFSLPTVSTE